MNPVSIDIDTIPIVDDIPENLHVLGQLLLGAGYPDRPAGDDDGIAA